MQLVLELGSIQREFIGNKDTGSTYASGGKMLEQMSGAHYGLNSRG